MTRIVLLLSAALLILGGCNKVEPIVNVERTEIYSVSGRTPSIEQVRVAISKAVVRKTWSVRQIAQDEIEARFRKGKKEAVIRIKYSPKFYSIAYKDSTYLLNKGNLIHRRYNAWIRGLQKQITRNLSDL